MFFSSKKNNDVVELTTYGQTGQLNKNDIFPVDYFVEEFLMNDNELSKRCPETIHCEVCNNNFGSYKPATFKKKKGSSSSYEIEIKDGWTTYKLIADHVVPMTPIGTELRNNGRYTLLVKDESIFGFDAKYFGDYVIVHFKRLFIVNHSTFFKTTGHLIGHDILKKYGYESISL